MYWHFGSLSLRTIRQVEKSPAAPHTHTHTMPAQWAHSRLSSCLRHLLLRLQLRLQTPKLPRCRADCGFREQPAVRNFKGLFCLSLERQKGMKAAGCGAGLQVHLRPLVRLFVPLSLCLPAVEPTFCVALLLLLLLCLAWFCFVFWFRNSYLIITFIVLHSSSVLHAVNFGL